MMRNSSRAVLIASLACAGALLVAAQALAATPPSKLYHGGRRWVGQARACAATALWRAEELPAVLRPSGSGATPLCLYTWLRAPQPPDATEISDLFRAAAADVMIEDVPVVVPMGLSAEWSSAEAALLAGLRSSFVQHVGNAALLRPWPTQKLARIAVLDSAPTAPDGAIAQGAGSRHGDTLIHLIEDIVCEPLSRGGRRCAAEVTSELALPWLNAGVSTPDGGHSGTPMDLARAIYSATSRWELDRATRPNTTPPRLILNLSLGWEHTLSIADCFADPTAAVDLPAKVVQAALQYAAERGAIVVAAAGNDSGGPSPRTGMTCPGAYQGLGRGASPETSLLTAVSGVDYGDQPLVSARSAGRTGLVGLAFDAVAWSGVEAPPPALVGSSVAAAVVSAISALVVARQPSWSPSQVTKAIYDGGVPLAAPADSCPLDFLSCATRRANVCGALLQAGVSPLTCEAAPAKGWSSPSLPSEIAALHSSVTPTMRAASFAPLAKDPRFLLPSMQVEPWTFPMPISATCPTCYLSDSANLAATGPSIASGPSPASAPDQLTIPALGRPLQIPMLLLHLEDQSWLGVELQGPLEEHVAYRFDLPSLPPVRAAYLAGFDWQEQHSIFEQLFVHR